MLKKLRTRADQEGFTLIELLIVITILGVLAAIVVFAVGTTSKDAHTNACKADVKTVETALEAYKAQNTAYPATTLTDAPATLLTLQTSGYLKDIPTETITFTNVNGIVNVGVTGGC